MSLKRLFFHLVQHSICGRMKASQVYFCYWPASFVISAQHVFTCCMLTCLVSKTTTYYSTEVRGFIIAAAFWTYYLYSFSEDVETSLRFPVKQYGVVFCPKKMKAWIVCVHVSMGSSGVVCPVFQFLLLIFSCLRKAAWDYGRLALLMDNDRWIHQSPSYTCWSESHVGI